MRAARPDFDDAIRAAWEARDFQAAATKALEAYGQELLTFLRARLRSPSDGDEAFSMLAEDLWKGLPHFMFRCSVRGWLYTLACNAANRYAKAPHNRRAHNLSISPDAPLSAVIDRVRSATQAYQRTDVKAKVRALREKLEVEDQTLLILHVDRGLAWRELAMVMHEKGEHLEGDALARETARLRKRFERVKAELRQMAVAEGLLGP
jgi:RNA polymerase sigma-70 factor, ECF subfamily